MRRALLCGLLLLFLPESIAFGQAKVGTAGAQFLEIGVSARAVGMGEAFLAISDDASALYYNPAGLVQIEKLELMASHIDYPVGISYEFLGLAYPASNLGGVWGLGFYMLSSGDIPLTTYYYPSDEDPFSSGQTFSAKEYALALSYAASLTDRFSVGLTFKYINQNYESENASGWAADVGTLYNTGFRGFKIAMAISNFGPDLKFIEIGYPLPMNFKFGGSLDVINNGSHRATFGLEGSHPNDNLEKFNGGIEYWYNDVFALRIGNHFANDVGGFTAGTGMKVNLSGFKLGFDYAYHDFGYLSQIHRFSVNAKF
jgi:hypothetical protein